jgi:hypothetical protein
MARTRRRKHEYSKRSFVDLARGPAKAGAESLLDGVLDLYPKADQARLRAWLKVVETHDGVEGTALLFFALVCGTRFRVYSPDMAKVLSRLWQWLTWAPRHMDQDLAALVVDALAPALEREFKTREGRRVGPGAAAEKVRGRPPVSRGAWVTASVTDGYLRQAGLGAADAKERTLELAAILTGREMASPEELRQANAALSNRLRLARALQEQLDWWVEHDDVGSASPGPESARPPGRSEWRRRHALLSSVLKRVGSQTLAEIVVARIPPAHWARRVRS